MGKADGVAAAMGGVYEFTKLAAANLREKDDSWNPTIGGFFAGAVVGLRGTSCVEFPYGLQELMDVSTDNTRCPRVRSSACGCSRHLRLHWWPVYGLHKG